MYFCPKCNYSFDIAKSSNNNVEDTRIEISKLPDAFKKLENNEDLSKYKATFKQDNLIKNAKYKSFDDNKKSILNKLFDEVISSGAEFHCMNCNYSKEITETVLLYEYTTLEKNDNFKTLEENKLYCLNPILARTRDYNCKNADCPTNKSDNEIVKEAVFYKNRNAVNVNYICCVCYTGW
jgi:hypothetical protein